MSVRNDGQTATAACPSQIWIPCLWWQLPPLRDGLWHRVTAVLETTGDAVNSLVVWADAGDVAIEKPAAWVD